MTRQIDSSLAKAGLPPLERAAWVEVDVDILVANARALSVEAGRAAVGAVVKADGYGHGLEMAARCAIRGGARWLCVANSGEALRLRSDGYLGRIFVLYPVPLHSLATMARLEVDVTVNGTDYLRRIHDHLDPDFNRLRVHLEVDTGMTRGGAQPTDTVELAERLNASPLVQVVGVWTHLAAPDDAEYTQSQMALFDSVLQDLYHAGVTPEVVHAAASGGFLATDTSGHGLVRPGLIYYGIRPGDRLRLPATITPALSIRSHPVRIAEVPAGTPVGYDRTWIAQRTSTIVTLPIGYADGWSRSSVPGTSVLVSGTRAPLVGRVSSDAITVDVTGIEQVDYDSVFTLIGHDAKETITADDVAAVRGTISWEVLQQLGSRLARVYVKDSKPVAVRHESSLEVLAGTDVEVPGYETIDELH